MSASVQKPTLLQSLIPVILAAGIILLGIVGFDEQVPVPLLLVLACIAPALLSVRLGHAFRDVEQGMVDGMKLSLKAVGILLVVGTTIAAWAACGTIGAMISYGLAVLNPNWFLPAAVLMCAVVSLAIGSSWATAATVGVALMGIGQALGVPAPMCAGAILSGSYFGDKMSPLSDTTNLAPGIAGSNLFEHIHAMFYTTFPAFSLALVLFVVLGLSQGTDGATFDAAAVEGFRNTIGQAQHISVWLLLPVVLVIGMALMKIPALVVLLAASVFGVILALLFQHVSASQLLVALYKGNIANTGSKAVDTLLSRGGMSSMLDTIALVLTATAFGGIMEHGGFIQVLLEALLRLVKGTAGLITSTVLACVGVNFLVAEQYLSIVLPGRMFKDTYARFNLQPRMLSRTLEDAGTVTSPLCPWNSCGAYMSVTLGVSTFAVVPFAFFNWLMPLIAIVFAWSDIFILRKSPITAPVPERIPAE